MDGVGACQSQTPHPVHGEEEAISSTQNKGHTRPLVVRKRVLRCSPTLCGSKYHWQNSAMTTK